MPSIWMKRFRWAVPVAICLLGVLAPWNRLLHLDGAGPNAHLWGVLAVTLGSLGTLGISGGFELILALGIAAATAAAILRTFALTRPRAPKPALAALAAIGAWLNIVALALLMPVSGAVFAVLATALWELAIWKAAVWKAAPGPTTPATLPSAILREIYFWGTALSFAIAGWWYNAGLIARCVLVSLGIAIVLRGLLPQTPRNSSK